jgi:hypothetical protein
MRKKNNQACIILCLVVRSAVTIAKEAVFMLLALRQSISYYIQIRKMVIRPIKQQVIKMTYTDEKVRAENMSQSNAYSL